MRRLDNSVGPLGNAHMHMMLCLVAHMQLLKTHSLLHVLEPCYDTYYEILCAICHVFKESRAYEADHPILRCVQCARYSYDHIHNLPHTMQRCLVSLMVTNGYYFNCPRRCLALGPTADKQSALNDLVDLLTCKANVQHLWKLAALHGSPRDPPVTHSWLTAAQLCASPHYDELSVQVQPLMATLNSIPDKEIKVVCSACRDYHARTGTRRDLNPNVLQDTCCNCAASAPPGSGRVILTTHIDYLNKQFSSEESVAEVQPLMATLNSIPDKETKVVCGACSVYHARTGTRRDLNRPALAISIGTLVLQWGLRKPRSQKRKPAGQQQLQRMSAHVR